MDYVKLILLFTTPFYIPLKFFANKPPLQEIVKRRLAQDNKLYTEEEFKQYYGDRWAEKWDSALEEKSVEWSSKAAMYCKKDRSVAIELKDYGFQVDFKQANDARCREKCAKDPSCKVYTYGQWNKKAFDLFGIVGYGQFFGQYRCQIYKSCELVPVDSSWKTAMAAHFKPENFVYEPPPPEHNLNVIATLATSLIMAVNILYVLEPEGLDLWCAIISVCAAIIAVGALYMNFLEMSSQPGGICGLLVIVYCVNIVCYLGQFFKEEKDQKRKLKESANRPTTSGKKAR